MPWWAMREESGSGAFGPGRGPHRTCSLLSVKLVTKNVRNASMMFECGRRGMPWAPLVDGGCHVLAARVSNYVALQGNHDFRRRIVVRRTCAASESDRYGRSASVQDFHDREGR